MGSDRPQLTIALALLLSVSCSDTSVAQDPERTADHEPRSLSQTKDGGVEISGEGLRCLLEVRKQMKRSHNELPMNELGFRIVEQPEFFEVSVDRHQTSRGKTVGGGLWYHCSKSSGAILARGALK
jgi:hypothetical protein